MGFPTYEDQTDWHEEYPKAYKAVEPLSSGIDEVFSAAKSGSDLGMMKVKSAIEPMIDSITRNPDACIWLARMKQADNYTYQHAIGTSIWAVALGRQLGLPQHDMRSLAVGGLLMDVGKLKVDAELLSAQRRLSAEEFSEVKEHVAHGLNSFDGQALINKDVVDMVAHHHERIDGTGYPQGLKDEAIPVFGRIAGIVDTYDAITSHRSYAKAMTPAAAVKHLYEERGHAFQTELVEEFIQAIGIYPAGTLVELSSGEVAIIVAEYRTRRLRPQVYVLLDQNKKQLAEPQMIDLLKTRETADGRELSNIGSLEPEAYGIDMRGVLAEPVTIGEKDTKLELRLGSATTGSGTTDPAAMLSRAEEAMSSSDSDINLEFTDTPQEAVLRAQDRAKLEVAFEGTLHANAFELYYQPKIDLRTGAVPACEALLRWPTADGGYISPQFAVELVESLNLGYSLTKWVLGEAMRQAKQWQEHLRVQISVNIEASLISNPDLYNLVSDTLAIWGADASLITLEITESAVIEDKESGFHSLRRLSELGVGLSIDDFGTGYSSLSYFKYIPAQELKIDQSFIKRMASDAQDRALVKIIVEVAHLFGMRVVSEGVQDEATLDLVRECGSDYAQGFFLGKPMPAAEFEQLLENWEGPAGQPHQG